MRFDCPVLSSEHLSHEEIASRQKIIDMQRDMTNYGGLLLCLAIKKMFVFYNQVETGNFGVAEKCENFIFNADEVSNLFDSLCNGGSIILHVFVFIIE